MYLKHNLNIINKHHPHLDILQQYYKKDNPVCYEKNIPYSIKINDQTIFLNSKYRPEKEIERLFNKVNLKNKNLIVYGFGFGYILKYLYSINYQEINKIIFIDVIPDIFYSALKLFDLTEELKMSNLYLIISSSSNVVFNSITKLFFNENIDDAEFIIHKPSYNIIPEKFSKLKNILNKVYNNDTFKSRFNDIIQNNYYENIKKINQSDSVNIFIKRIIKKYKKGVLIGAGPSLDYYYKKIKDFKNSGAFIISVDAALYALLKNDIIPDAVVSIDPQEITEKFFQNINCFNFDLIYSLFNYKSISSFPFKNKFYFIPQSHYFIKKNSITSFSKNDMLKGGASVSIYALELLIKSGCAEIHIFGQDFSFPDYKIYSLNTIRMIEYYNTINKFKSIESLIFNGLSNKLKYYNGIPTYSNLLDYKREFELFINEFSNIKYNNYMHNGLYIKGCKLYSL